MKVIYSSDKTVSESVLSLPEEIFNLFIDSNIMATHEKL